MRHTVLLMIALLFCRSILKCPYVRLRHTRDARVWPDVLALLRDSDNRTESNAVNPTADCMPCAQCHFGCAGVLRLYLSAAAAKDKHEVACNHHRTVTIAHGRRMSHAFFARPESA